MSAIEALSVYGLSGKTALVTGAGSGIGRATAELFAEVGGRVLLVDIVESDVREAAEAVGAPWAVCDISDEAQVWPPSKRRGGCSEGWTCWPMSPPIVARPIR